VSFSEHKGKISLGGSKVVKEFTRIVKISSGLLEDWTQAQEVAEPV